MSTGIADLFSVAWGLPPFPAVVISVDRRAVMGRARIEAPRGMRIGNRNDLAANGRAPANSRADRVLPPIQESGDALRALERSGDRFPRS